MAAQQQLETDKSLKYPAWRGPLFVAGPSRSGTALIRSILNNHSLIHLAAETHYFDDLRMRFGRRRRSRLSKAEAELCADYFRALDDRPYGMKGCPEKSSTDRDRLVEQMKNEGGSIDSAFETYCRVIAERHGGTIWGEKTPRHIFRLNDIFEIFSKARVICMVRDPRAVVASYRDWRNQGGLAAEDDAEFQNAIRQEERRTRVSYNIVIATLLWRAAANAAMSAVERYGAGRVKAVRYEDIIADPQAKAVELCDWLGIQFEPGLLDVPLHNSSVQEFKRQAGVSSVPLRRWRHVLSGREMSIIQAVAGESLTCAGYQKENSRAAIPTLAWEFAKIPFAFVRVFFVNRRRMGNMTSFIWRRFRAAFAA